MDGIVMAIAITKKKEVNYKKGHMVGFRKQIVYRITKSTIMKKTVNGIKWIPRLSTSQFLVDLTSIPFRVQHYTISGKIPSVDVKEEILKFLNHGEYVMPAKNYRATYTVMEDTHSLYIMVAGKIYRPVFPKVYQEAYKDGSSLKTGQKVVASARFDANIANLRTLDEKIDESWFSHADGWKPTNYLTW